MCVCVCVCVCVCCLGSLGGVSASRRSRVGRCTVVGQHTPKGPYFPTARSKHLLEAPLLRTHSENPYVS